MTDQVKVFEIEGMDCADCALKNEKAVSKIPGEKLTEVSFLTSKLRVVAEASQFDEWAVLLATKGLGCYSAKAEGSAKNVILYIEDMDYVDEAEIIEKNEIFAEAHPIFYILLFSLYYKSI